MIDFDGVDDTVPALEEYWFCENCLFKGDYISARKHKRRNPDHKLHHYLKTGEGEWVDGKRVKKFKRKIAFTLPSELMRVMEPGKWYPVLGFFTPEATAIRVYDTALSLGDILSGKVTCPHCHREDKVNKCVMRVTEDEESVPLLVYLCSRCNKVFAVEVKQRT